MTNEDKIQAIEEWQGAECVHPLTCGKDSNHELLRAEEDNNGSVILKCGTCGWIQKEVPLAVLNAYQDGSVRLQAAQTENLQLKAKLGELGNELEGYKEAHGDKKRLTRKIDVIMHGEGAAKQASLCDLIAPIKKLVEECERFKREVDNLNSSNIHLAKMSLAEKDEDKENLVLAARLVMRDAFEKDGNFYRSYIANIAMLLHDRDWITEHGPRNEAAEAVLKLLFWDER